MKAKSMLTKVSLLVTPILIFNMKRAVISNGCLLHFLMIYTFCFQLLTSAQAHMFIFWRLGANWCCHDTDAYEERKRKEKKKHQRLQRESNNDNSELQNDEN